MGPELPLPRLLLTFHSNFFLSSEHQAERSSSRRHLSLQYLCDDFLPPTLKSDSTNLSTSPTSAFPKTAPSVPLCHRGCQKCPAPTTSLISLFYPFKHGFPSCETQQRTSVQDVEAFHISQSRQDGPVGQAR